MDVRDIATLVLKIFGKEMRLDRTREELDEMNKKFLNTKVGDIIGANSDPTSEPLIFDHYQRNLIVLDLSRGDPSLAVSGLSPVFQTIGLFQKGVNRYVSICTNYSAFNNLILRH